MVRIVALTLILLGLNLTVYAQSSNQEREKPTSQSPSGGTAGTAGGPSGLFTIYDGSTLRRGEHTFSIAYSNYDRDPGNVDIVDIPLSFNVGLNDHIEIFFKINAMRGIKVNNPNLSSFYLPNSQLFCGTTLCSGSAIILAPQGQNVATLRRTAILRQWNNQPFVQNPFSTGSVATLESKPVQLGSWVGLSEFEANLGPSIVQPNSGTFGSADNFPGIGSRVGSILPGIVLTTTVLSPTLVQASMRGHGSFSGAPTYLPDAPFVNSYYGESGFTAGSRIRLTRPGSPFGFALIPSYSWHPGDATDLSAHSQLQRGASPGGDIGSIIDGRISKHVNLSANGSYILTNNSNDASDLVLLKRPDEFRGGVGFDSPINENFQPIAEVMSSEYVRTIPSSFENSPVDLHGGIRIFPERWFERGNAYRLHLNQQKPDDFIPANFNIPINQVTNVNLPGGGSLIAPETTHLVISSESPTRFSSSKKPNSFINEFWIGRRNSRKARLRPHVDQVSSSVSSILLPCPLNTISACAPGDSVQLAALTTDPDDDTLLYVWSVTGGGITGAGSNVTWDLTGVSSQDYLPPAPRLPKTYSDGASFLSSQTSESPKAFKGSSFYAMTRPSGQLVLGNYVWDPLTSEEDRARIRLVLQQGQEDAKKVCTYYGDYSLQCRYFREAINSFGPEGVDNGVTIAVVQRLTIGAGAETTVAPCVERTARTEDNPTGQRTTVSFSKATVKSYHLKQSVRHEGSHVADGLKWRASGCKPSSNPYLFDTEYKAYLVAGLSAEVQDPNVPYEFLVPGGKTPGINPVLPKRIQIHNPDWKPEDRPALRDAGIKELLGVPKPGGGLYQVTPEFRGMKAFGRGLRQ